MNLDKYELELLKDIEAAENIEQVDNYEDEIFEAKLAAKNFLTKLKISIFVLLNMTCLCLKERVQR